MPPQPDLSAVAARQSGAVTVQQCLAAGCTRSWVERRVRSGLWQRLHRGVVVTHSGPVLWTTRTWAALLHAGPGAALSHQTAGYVHRLLAPAPDVVAVSVPHSRRVVASAGVVVVRRRVMPEVTRSRLPGGPAVVGAPATVVDLIAVLRDEDEIIGLLAEAARRGVPAQAVLAALDARLRPRAGPLVRSLIAGVAEGVESPLEHRYVRDVERRHGLPTGRAQVPAIVGGRSTRADRLYAGVRIELDGALFHSGARGDADVWRDNAALLERDEITLRYRWRHVALDPCTTATQVAVALRARGWTGTPRRCAPACTVAPR